MSGISGALNIASWSLYSSQLAMEVISHNIANANTPGYSRQSLQVEANYPITVGPGQIGTGVKATEVTREYDDFINEQVTLKKSQYYYWEARKNAMDEIETVFNESEGYGINHMMSEFWNAWSDLSNNPDGIPEREALLAKSENLIQLIGEMDYNLREYQRHLDSTIQGSVDQINTIIEEIADLNKQISSVEIEGLINANDLRDRRELLLEELSTYMDISYYEEEQSGQVMVYILGGTPLVLGKDSYSLDVERDATTGFTNVLWQGNGGRTVDIMYREEVSGTLTPRMDGGKLAGWVSVRDTNIGSYIDSMNNLVQELVWHVNSLHSEGVGLESVESMVGSVEVSGLGDILGTDFLFSDGFNAGGSFDIIVYEDATGDATRSTITLAAGATVGDLITAVDGLGNLNAEIDADNHVHIYSDAGYSFAVNPDESAESSHALAIVGINTFFTWTEQVGTPLSDLTETLEIDSALVNNSSLIATGHVDSNNAVSPGANEVALGIYSLQDQVITDFGGTGINTTMDAYYSSFIAEVGVDVQNADLNMKFNDTLLDQYIKRKESITGVNLDEEMANLLKFQHLYQAAAKLISIADEMMQALLSTK
ncbi:MAG TPA: flagellar hook-associated protein FlgK [Deltaproteobacteria bacterium]|nr:flagellar hook-associated protein FlgK [Deltaproteobacteria bacterium]